MVQRPRLWGQNQEPAVHHRQGNLRGSGGLRGDPPLSLASATLESKHHPTPFRPAVPQGLQSPCVTDHSCVPVTADSAHCQGALLLGQPLSGHGATGTLLVLLTSQRLIQKPVLWRV